MRTAPRTHEPRTIWADLDALVLEEVDALSRPTVEAPASDFATPDAFIAAAVAFLRQQPDPLPIIDDICTELGITAEGRGDMPDEEFAGPEPEASADRPATEEPPKEPEP